MEEKGANGNGIGFCDLSLEEWQRILGTIELADTNPHPKDLVASLIKDCAILLLQYHWQISVIFCVLKLIVFF